MAEHTWEELHKLTVVQLRQLAAELGDNAPRGYTQLHKAPLVEALCGAFGVEAGPHHEVVGINKARVKRQIRELKVERAAALEARDRKEFQRVLRQIHRLKHRLRRATV